MVALPTPARLATPSTLSAEKPTSASSASVASRIALCASSLRGRPALAPFAFGESEASAFAIRPHVLAAAPERGSTTVAQTGRRRFRGPPHYDTIRSVLIHRPGAPGASARKIRHGRATAALGSRGRRRRGRARGSARSALRSRRTIAAAGGRAREGAAARRRLRLRRRRGLRPQQPQDARARDRRFGRGGPRYFEFLSAGFADPAHQTQAARHDAHRDRVLRARGRRALDRRRGPARLLLPRRARLARGRPLSLGRALRGRRARPVADARPIR